MVARIRMNGITTVHHDVDATCPVVIGFVNSLLDESLEMGSAPTFRCFEMEHRIYPPRCGAFGGEEV